MAIGNHSIFRSPDSGGGQLAAISKFGLLVILTATGCVKMHNGMVSPAVPHASGPADGSVTLEGTLAGARCYFTLGAPKGDDRYCSFISMKSDGPAGLIMGSRQFVYLAIESHVLAEFAARPLRIHGESLYGGRLLKPEQVWVYEAGAWKPVTL